MRHFLVALAAVVVCFSLGGAVHAGRGGRSARSHGHHTSRPHTHTRARSARPGVALRGRQHHFTHVRRSAKYRRKCYWSSRYRRWYYWHRASGCYYPMDCADEITPDEDEDEE